MRSGDRPARVRIELLGQTLRAVDPDDKNRSCTLATGVDENRIRDVKYSLWEGFNDVRQGCAFGGVLSSRAGADVARRLYIQGARDRKSVV